MKRDLPLPDTHAPQFAISPFPDEPGGIVNQYPASHADRAIEHHAGSILVDDEQEPLVPSGVRKSIATLPSSIGQLSGWETMLVETCCRSSRDFAIAVPDGGGSSTSVAQMEHASSCAVASASHCLEASSVGKVVSGAACWIAATSGPPS